MARTITLTEYLPTVVPLADLSEAEAGQIVARFGERIKVTWPSLHQPQQWILCADGWVGIVPVTPNLTLILQPRVPVRSIFALLEYAFDLRSLHILEGAARCETLDEVYTFLADLLARWVLDGVQQGIARDYRDVQDRLPYLRGRLATRDLTRSAPTLVVECVYGELTADIRDNQILLAGLWAIARGPLTDDAVRRRVRQAMHRLRGAVTLLPLTSADCLGRRYQRTNAGYRPLHALCAFFIDAAGPGTATGDHPMVPFMVSMPRLFERCVAGWLARHLPADLHLTSQERYVLDPLGKTTFIIDLVISDQATGQALYVLDTKYKPTTLPESADISQIIAYAYTKQCAEAILIYPLPVSCPLEIIINAMRVRSLSFALDQEIEGAGKALLAALADPRP